MRKGVIFLIAGTMILCALTTAEVRRPRDSRRDGGATDGS
jgi:hypothetical protein